MSMTGTATIRAFLLSATILLISLNGRLKSAGELSLGMESNRQGLPVKSRAQTDENLLRCEFVCRSFMGRDLYYHSRKPYKDRIQWKCDGQPCDVSASQANHRSSKIWVTATFRKITTLKATTHQPAASPKPSAQRFSSQSGPTGFPCPADPPTKACAQRCQSLPRLHRTQRCRRP